MVNCLSKHPLKRGVSVNTRSRTGEIHKISPVLLCLGSNWESDVIEFSAAVAEVITNILDVDGDREFFRDMFTRSKSTRDYIMRNDRGDEELLYLKRAMEELKIKSDLKSDFWRIVADCLGVGYKDEKLLIVVMDILCR